MTSPHSWSTATCPFTWPLSPQTCILVFFTLHWNFLLASSAYKPNEDSHCTPSLSLPTHHWVSWHGWQRSCEGVECGCKRVPGAQNSECKVRRLKTAEFYLRESESVSLLRTKGGLVLKQKVECLQVRRQFMWTVTPREAGKLCLLTHSLPTYFSNCGRTISVGILNLLILFPDEVSVITFNYWSHPFSVFYLLWMSHVKCSHVRILKKRPIRNNLFCY